MFSKSVKGHEFDFILLLEIFWLQRHQPLRNVDKGPEPNPITEHPDLEGSRKDHPDPTPGLGFIEL